MLTTNQRCLDSTYVVNRVENFDTRLLFQLQKYIMIWTSFWMLPVKFAQWTELHEIWLELSPTWLSHSNDIEISHREWTLQTCACFIISGSANKGAVCFYFTEWVLLGLLWVYMAKTSDKQSQ